MKTRLLFTFLALAFATTALEAQTPVVVQAVPAANVPAVVQPAAAGPAASAQAALQQLQAVKAANDELLKKQATTLLQLEEMEKAAEQIKIYSKRG